MTFSETTDTHRIMAFPLVHCSNYEANRGLMIHGSRVYSAGMWIFQTLFWHFANVNDIVISRITGFMPHWNHVAVAEMGLFMIDQCPNYSFDILWIFMAFTCRTIELVVSYIMAIRYLYINTVMFGRMFDLQYMTDSVPVSHPGHKNIDSHESSRD